jgi:hypothetical protein
MPQIPRGEDHLYCPFWQKPQSEVCHKCPLWVQLRGKDPQSTQEVDAWGCSLMWLPKLLIEGAQQSRQAGASADKVATEVAKFHENMVKMNHLASAQLAIGRHDDRECQ